jgi:hypothetical protein
VCSEISAGNAREILTRVQTLNSGRRLVVSTVGLGDDQDQGFLTALATENGGQYIKR